MTELIVRSCLSPLNPVGVKDLESDTKGDRTHCAVFGPEMMFYIHSAKLVRLMIDTQ